MDSRDEGWSLVTRSPRAGSGRAERRLLDALRHARSTTVRRVKLGPAGGGVLWEIDAADALEAFVRSSIAHAASGARRAPGCLSDADVRAIRAFEERDSDATDLVAAARDEAARRVIHAVRAVKEKEYLAERRKLPDLEDAVRDALRESALAHAASALDDALAHGLEGHGGAARVVEDVARASAWVATAERGGVSLDWDRVMDATRDRLEEELESRLLSLAPAPREPVVVAPPPPVTGPERARAAEKPARVAQPPAELLAVPVQPNRVPVPELTRALQRPPIEVAFEYDTKNGVVTVRVAAVTRVIRERLVRTGADLGWVVKVMVRERKTAATFLAHPLASSAWTTSAVAEARAIAAPEMPLGAPPPDWMAFRPWVECPVCTVALSPEPTCDPDRTRCPRCGHRGRVVTGPRPNRSGLHSPDESEEHAAPARDTEASAREVLAICSICLVPSRVWSDERALAMCPHCDRVGSLELA
jgi:hypothetical protein